MGKRRTNFKPEVGDEFTEMGFHTMNPIRISSDANNVTPKLYKLGKQNGITLEVFFVSALQRFVIFGRNGRGLRWMFLKVENSDHSFRNLDSRTINEAKKIFWINQNVVKFFMGERRKRESEKENQFYKEKAEFEYIGKYSQRLFRRLSRALGYSSGKTNIPY
jgi:hypothetical protein